MKQTSGRAKYQCKVRTSDECEPCGSHGGSCRFCGAKLPDNYRYQGAEPTYLYYDPSTYYGA